MARSVCIVVVLSGVVGVVDGAVDVCADGNGQTERLALGADGGAFPVVDHAQLKGEMPSVWREDVDVGGPPVRRVGETVIVITIAAMVADHGVSLPCVVERWRSGNRAVDRPEAGASTAVADEAGVGEARDAARAHNVVRQRLGKRAVVEARFQPVRHLPQ